MRLIASALVIVLLVGGPLSAYEEDFHYYVVYLLLRSRGYDPQLADWFAGFSQYVDDNAQTEPLKCTFARRARFHFAGSSWQKATTVDFESARMAVTQAFDEYNDGAIGAKYRLGAALHLFADTFSHAGFTAYWNRGLNCRAGSLRPCVGHADTEEDGHWPDRPYNASPNALRAARALYDLIPLASSGRPISWSALEPELRRAIDGRGSIEARIVAILRAIGNAGFGERVKYDRARFSGEKPAFESAVLR